MSSGIGSPNPHSSRIVNSHTYAPRGVMVDRWAMNHFTRGCLRGGDPIKYHNIVRGRGLTIRRVERTVLPDEGVPNAQAS